MHAADRKGFKKVTVTTLGCVGAAIVITNGCLYAAVGSLADWPLATLIATTSAVLIAPIASYSNVQMAHRLQNANQRLKALSETDPLTEALNRRRFREVAQQQLALAERHCYPTSLLLLDIDHFKQVNDQHGHAMGDRALVEITKVMQTEFGDCDTLARFGGEEFILLLPHTAREGALAVAERIRKAARNHGIKGESGQAYITISIGGVTCGTSATALDTLISRADKLLYEAKQAGRDRRMVEAIPAHIPPPILQKQVS